jgi:hypothetical protein
LTHSGPDRNVVAPSWVTLWVCAMERSHRAHVRPCTTTRQRSRRTVPSPHRPGPGASGRALAACQRTVAAH